VKGALVPNEPLDLPEGTQIAIEFQILSEDES
jgi:predicted DNA-binding antitoxin AbrB/MazE fold protein